MLLGLEPPRAPAGHNKPPPGILTSAARPLRSAPFQPISTPLPTPSVLHISLAPRLLRMAQTTRVCSDFCQHIHTKHAAAEDTEAPHPFTS
jgi:hypothetical protein